MPSPSAFIRSYVAAMSQHTDAPEIFHLGCAYAVVGALLSRESHKLVMAEGVPRLWTNEYVILIAPSGAGHKGTAIHMAEDVLLRVDNADTVPPGTPMLRAPDDMSPEGLLDHLQQRSTNPGGASAILIQDEWVNLLMQMRRSYSQQLGPHLLTFYNVQPTYVRKLRRSNIQITQPRLSMLGGITLKHLAQFGSAEEWEAGFYNRCLFIAAEPSRRQEEAPRVPDKLYDRLAAPLRNALDARVAASEKRAWTFTEFSRAAMAARKGLDLGTDRPQLHQMLSRSQVHLAKIAAIEQFDEDPEAKCIEAPAVQRARSFIEAWQAGIPNIIESAYARGRADYEGDRLARSVLRFLRERKDGALLQEVMLACGLNGDLVRAALGSLCDAELAHAKHDGAENDSPSRYFAGPPGGAHLHVVK